MQKHNDYKYTPEGLVEAIMAPKQGSRMSKEQTLMFKQIFLGGVDAEGRDIAPSIRHLQHKWNNIPADEVEHIAQLAFTKLLNRGKHFGWKYFQKRVDLDCMNYLSANVREERILAKAHYSSDVKVAQYKDHDGDVVSDYYYEPEQSPEIAWKEPLTKDEESIASALMAGMTQRQITDTLGIHPRDQIKLKQQLAGKAEII